MDEWIISRVGLILAGKGLVFLKVLGYEKGRKGNNTMTNLKIMPFKKKNNSFLMKVSKNLVSQVLATLEDSGLWKLCVYVCVCVLLHACGLMRVDEGQSGGKEGRWHLCRAHHKPGTRQAHCLEYYLFLGIFAASGPAKVHPGKCWSYFDR